MWRAATNLGVVKYADKLPWLMAYNSSSCFLYDPYYKRQYTVYSGDSRTSRDIDGTKVLASKHGWVLFSQRATSSEFFYNPSSVFFYNPFTNKMIQLPKLLIPELEHVGTFSTSPDCPDCMIVIFRPIYYNMLRISLCKHGETQWTDFLFVEDYAPFIESVEYVDGVFYCSLHTRAIGVFNAALKKWDLLPYPQTGEGFIIFNYLIECDGDLLLAHYLSNHCQWRVLRCDISQWNWFQVKSLENKSLFISCASMCLPVEDASELANKIHLQDKYVERPESHPTFSSDIQISQNYSWSLYHQYQAHPESRPSCPQVISHIYDWNVSGLKKFWIQLPNPR